MPLKRALIALYTLIYQELQRMMRIWIQAFLGPIINIFLYFLIFGNIIAQRIGPIDGIPYLEFITPGLILISVINTSYSNVSSSLFIARFQRSIEEILVSPIPPTTILFAFVLGGIIRGFIVALLLTLIVIFIFHIQITYHLNLIMDLLLTTSVCSLMGFINGLHAKDFDEILLIPSFILTPLSYLGGVFYSLDMLPKPWDTLAAYNPLVYLIQIFRAHALNLNYSNNLKVYILSLGITFFLFLVCCKMMKNNMLLKK
jgi:ABC-2 type transport system permease protein